MAVLREEDEKLANKVRFIQMVIDGKLVVSKKKKSALLAELKTLKFKPFMPKSKTNKPATAVPDGMLFHACAHTHTCTPAQQRMHGRAHEYKSHPTIALAFDDILR